MTVAKPLNVSTETTPDRAIGGIKIGALAQPSYPTRLLDTDYQNTSDGPKLVAVILNLSNTLGGSVSDALAETGIDTSNFNAVAEAAITGVAALIEWQTIFFLVPPGWFYHVLDHSSGGGGVAIVSWIEYNL
jgi:hypothetical protein